MNKIKKLVLVIILIILSVLVFTIRNDDIGDENSTYPNSSQTVGSSLTEYNQLQPDGYENDILILANGYLFRSDKQTAKIKELYNTDNVMCSDIEQSAYNITLLLTL